MFIKKVILFCVFVLVCPLVSQGNDGPPPSVIKSIEQKSQSACITMKLYSLGSYGGSAYDLWRDSVSIFNKQVFDAEQACDSYTYCRGEAFGIDCDTEPEYCFDCDNDGIPECSGYCDTDYYMVIADLCVPEGSYKYSLYYYGNLDDVTNFTIKDNVPLQSCNDKGNVCGSCVSYEFNNPIPEEEDEGKEKEMESIEGFSVHELIKSSDDDSDSGCGCSVSNDPRGTALFLFIIAVGFSALLISRKRYEK